MKKWEWEEREYDSLADLSTSSSPCLQVWYDILANRGFTHQECMAAIDEWWVETGASGG